MSGLFVVSGRADSVTVFTSFEPGHVYDSGNGDLVENVPGAFQALAAAFIPDQSGTLEGVDLGMSKALGGRVFVSLFADKNNSPDSANKFTLGSIFPTSNSVLSLPNLDTLSLTLHAGTQYWIGLQSTSNPA